MKYSSKALDFYAKHEERILVLTHHGTLLVTTCQTVVAMHSSHVFKGGKRFDSPFGALLKLFEIFSLVGAGSRSGKCRVGPGARRRGEAG